MDTVSDNDPTGFVPAALAAVRLVGAVAQVAPQVKKSVDNYRNNHAGAGAQVGAGVNRLTSPNDPAAALTLQVDPERESRAYETVNYVLRTLGNRIGEAGLVSAPALARALTAAATHIEVELFSVNANRLFKSLASKLKDAVLVNSVFTSIYFIGAITAELSSSLPQYKASYPPLGPFIIQQIFRAAIGEDAFRENITANLDAYKTLATTAGLLRPTDIGYSIFPGFPSLSPTRYSAKSFADVRNHKNIFQALVKHFDFHGFPQPKPGLDVGPIKDWRFLSGDANSKWYEVEKADKHIGEAIGRVLYWLICSADRMPPGMAVIAYYKQHIELIQWMGSRFGYRVLTGKQHLDLSGPHLRLENKYRATIEAWVIIMPSETAQLNKQQAVAQWNHINQPQPPTSISPTLSNASTSQARLSVSSSVSSVDNASLPLPKPGGNSTAQPNGTGRSLGIGSAIAHAGAAARRSESYPKPSGAQPVPHSNLSSPGLPVYTETPSTVASPTEQSTASTPATSAATEFLTSAQSEPFTSADFGHPAASFPAHLSPSSVGAGTAHPPPRAHPGPHHASINLPQPPSANYFPPLSNASHNPAAAPPSYSPSVSSQISGSSMSPSQPLVNNRPQPVVRRRAPPPPPKFPLGRALYDFGPEEEDGEELLFYEGDELEIVEKSEELEADGWCKARLKGTTHVGLAPLEYIEEIKVVKKAPPRPGGAARMTMAPGPANAAPTQVSARSLSGGQRPSGHSVPQNGGISRSLSSTPVSGRPHGAMKPQLVGIHENPHSHPMYHPNPDYHQNPIAPPQSGAFQNPHPHPHSHIPVNQQMQHNMYAHPVHSTHTELPGQQFPGSQRPPSYAPQGPQEFPVNQGPTKPQSNTQQTSQSGSGIAGEKPSQSNDIKVDVQTKPPSQRPTSTQQAPATQPNQTTPGQQGGRIRPPGNRITQGQAANGRFTNQQAAGLNVAANLSLNVAGGGGPNNQQGQGQNPNQMQNNAVESQHYSSVGGAPGVYSDNSNSNSNYNMQAEGQYGPNAGYMQPTYAEPPMVYGTSGYFDPGYEAEAGTSGGGLALSEGVDPSSFISSVNDLASLDPSYAQMNPEFTSDASTIDATERCGGADYGADESTSALASLGLDADGSTAMGQSAATDRLGPGINVMESPLAALAPQDDGSGGDRSTGGEGSGFDTGVSPLAVLAPPDDIGAASAADMGAGADYGAAFDDGASGAYDTMDAAQAQAEMEEAGYANASGLISETTYVQEETTTSFWSSMGGDDDDGFGYS